MQIPKEINDAFYSGELSEGIHFRLNDFVEIQTAKEKGKRGWVISILALNPEPSFLVELQENGHDVEVLQSNMKLLNIDLP